MNKTTAKETTEKQISELDPEALLKMDLAELCDLSESTNAEGRKRLAYIMEKAMFEERVRKIVREELAAAKGRKNGKTEE